MRTLVCLLGLALYAQATPVVTSIFEAQLRGGNGAQDWAAGAGPAGQPQADNATFPFTRLNGVPVPFRLQYDGDEVSLRLAGICGLTGPAEVSFEIDQPGALNMFEFWVQAKSLSGSTSRASITLSDLWLDGVALGSFSSLATPGNNGQVASFSGPVDGDFILTGLVTMAWQGAFPRGSRLDAHFYGLSALEAEPAEAPVPEPKTLLLIGAALLLLPLIRKRAAGQVRT